MTTGLWWDPGIPCPGLSYYPTPFALCSSRGGGASCGGVVGRFWTLWTPEFAEIPQHQVSFPETYRKIGDQASIQFRWTSVPSWCHADGEGIWRDMKTPTSFPHPAGCPHQLLSPTVRRPGITPSSTLFRNCRPFTFSSVFVCKWVKKRYDNARNTHNITCRTDV